MGLAKYHQKRDFGATPEPKGAPLKERRKKLAFVVQEHHASSLHYDFRLELDGVLKSWAVPKGPSMDPHDHHLAVHVEDHPFAYRAFEGEIPAGNYGAGTVSIWDQGTYEPRAETNNPEEMLQKELKAGHITFILHGKKLKGEFALVKMHSDDEKNWLLVKKSDEFAQSGSEAKPHTSQLDLQQFPGVKAPWHVHPMLSTLTEDPFDNPDWLFEIKWDGYRAIGSKHADSIELYSRTGNDFAVNYPPIAEALRELRHDVILDGEIVVIDEEGRPHFELMQNWRKDKQGSLTYYVFDILWCDGHDVRTMPLAARKELLKRVVGNGQRIRYSDHIAAKGTALFAEMQRRGLEGMVAKKADSQYVENKRGDTWLKIKTHLRQEVVIGGFTEPRGTRRYLGSLLLGVYDGDNFIYVGHSGGGIPDTQREQLRKKLDRLERKTSPFATEPKPNAPVHWVHPEIVAEMSFSEWTQDGSMRHPQFEGTRPDKKPHDVHREKSKKIIPAGASKKEQHMTNEPAFTHLDKVFFPKHKYTKGDIIGYYRSVADFILPYLKDRPLSLLRQPNGINGESFFQKNNEHLPAWVPAADIYSDSHKDTLHWIIGGALETLLYAVQLGSIEINPWNSRLAKLDHPDWVVIDLDPEGVPFRDVITVAKDVKKICDEWGIDSCPKTSGKTGIHIFIPLHARYTYEQAKNFAHLLALEIHKRQPERTSVERMPEKRKHKIYLDFLQNREGQTLAAPYSVRPTPDASVSMPLHWDEVNATLAPTNFTIKNAARRLSRTGDLWKPVMGKGIAIEAVLKKLGG